MRRLPILIVLMLTLIGCAPENASTAASTTTTIAASTTTSTEATTTTIPVGTIAPLDQPDADNQLFDVTGIETGSITGYAGAGTNTDQVAALQAGTVALETTGETDESIDGTIWRELKLQGGATAWFDTAFLSPNETAAVNFSELPCSGFGTPTGELARSAPSVSDADHIAQIWQIDWLDCTRVVIALGADFDFDGSSPLAGAVPGDISVEAFGTWARVTLPGLQWTRFDASEHFGDVTVVAARSVDGGMVVDAHAGSPGEFFARFLSEPARIVIDILPSNVAAVALAAPVVGDGVVLAESLPPAVDLPLTISGYSRWFEAGGFVIVRRFNDEPGTGEIIGAVVEGDSVVNPGADTEWGIMATDWLDAWGMFSFELNGLVGGSYELFIGECVYTGDGDTCENLGVYLPLIVSG